ncbi:MAG: anthranilate synthase component 1 [Idiomarina sp.]|nr:anthranilate synthase component 1 [Idiomarina sp.]
MTEQKTLESIQLCEVLPIVLSTPYHQDPLETFAGLRSIEGEHLLLESAEIDSRQHLKSLMLIDASLRFVCRGQQVTITALSDNGQILLNWLEAELVDSANLKVQRTTTSLELDFPLPDATLNESERLQSIANVEPLRLIQQRLQTLREHPFAVFLGGVFAYDLLATFEQLPDIAEGENDCPDYQFYLAETLLVIDHQAQQAELIGTLPGGENCQARYEQLCRRLGEVVSRMQLPGFTQTAVRTNQTTAKNVQATPSDKEFLSIVEHMKQSIAAGDIFQVVPSRRFTVDCANALASYAELKRANPSPYMFYLQTPEFQLFGASPESALKYTASNRHVELYPIAGTRSRARAADGTILKDQDSRVELELRTDTKELAEHMMLVDLARNDLARIGVTGSRYVADLLKVDRYSHVMHLVSRVVATLKPELDALDAYRACMNMGTLVGAPKISAARLIRGAEQQRRGSYGGAVGYLRGNGDMDTCIVIRAAYVKNGQAIIQAGAGVVFDSDPQLELRETEQKAQAVIHAILTANEHEEARR